MRRGPKGPRRFLVLYGEIRMRKLLCIVAVVTDDVALSGVARHRAVARVGIFALDGAGGTLAEIAADAARVGVALDIAMVLALGDIGRGRRPADDARKALVAVAYRHLALYISIVDASRNIHRGRFATDAARVLNAHNFAIVDATREGGVLCDPEDAARGIRFIRRLIGRIDLAIVGAIRERSFFTRLRGDHAACTLCVGRHVAIVDATREHDFAVGLTDHAARVRCNRDAAIVGAIRDIDSDA